MTNWKFSCILNLPWKCANKLITDPSLQTIIISR